LKSQREGTVYSFQGKRWFPSAQVSIPAAADLVGEGKDFVEKHVSKAKGKR